MNRFIIILSSFLILFQFSIDARSSEKKPKVPSTQAELFSGGVKGGDPRANALVEIAQQMCNRMGAHLPNCNCHGLVSAWKRSLDIGPALVEFVDPETLPGGALKDKDGTSKPIVFSPKTGKVWVDGFLWPAMSYVSRFEEVAIEISGFCGHPDRYSFGREAVQIFTPIFAHADVPERKSAPATENFSTVEQAEAYLKTNPVKSSITVNAKDLDQEGPYRYLLGYTAMFTQTTSTFGGDNLLMKRCREASSALQEFSSPEVKIKATCDPVTDDGNWFNDPTMANLTRFLELRISSGDPLDFSGEGFRLVNRKRRFKDAKKCEQYRDELSSREKTAIISTVDERIAESRVIGRGKNKWTAHVSRSSGCPSSLYAEYECTANNEIALVVTIQPQAKPLLYDPVCTIRR
jgi:hypothetical protein